MLRMARAWRQRRGAASARGDPGVHRNSARSERGFVLLVVLSALGLLALVAATFAQVARSHLKLATLAADSARAEALADAGVQMAILDLVAARGSQRAGRRFALDATPLACSVGGGAMLTIAVLDEAGKVDLNIANPQLLRALALGLGLSGGEAAVDAILDYRDEDDNRHPSGAERAEYLAAGRMQGPRNGPFLAVEELASVLGVSPADADLLRPFVTIHSGLTAIDMNVAPQALVDVLARGLQEGGGSSRPLPSAFGAGGLPSLETRAGLLPPQFLAASTRRAFSVYAQARTAQGATFVREAVVEFVAPNASGYLLRRWRRGSAASPDNVAAGGLPPC